MDNQPDENCNLLFHHPRNSFSARKPSTVFMRRFSVSLEEDIKETGMHLRKKPQKVTSLGVAQALFHSQKEAMFQQNISASVFMCGISS